MSILSAPYSWLHQNFVVSMCYPHEHEIRSCDLNGVGWVVPHAIFSATGTEAFVYSSLIKKHRYLLKRALVSKYEAISKPQPFGIGITLGLRPRESFTLKPPPEVMPLCSEAADFLLEFRFKTG